MRQDKAVPHVEDPERKVNCYDCGKRILARRKKCPYCGAGDSVFSGLSPIKITKRTVNAKSRPIVGVKWEAKADSDWWDLIFLKYSLY